jgi:hypothetical protein
VDDRHDDPHRALDPGAFIGREPELGDDVIPGGARPEDERVAANATQGTGSGRPDVRGQPEEEPAGHRSGPVATDDAIREAGQDR